MHCLRKPLLLKNLIRFLKLPLFCCYGEGPIHYSLCYEESLNNWGEPTNTSKASGALCKFLPYLNMPFANLHHSDASLKSCFFDLLCTVQWERHDRGAQGTNKKFPAQGNPGKKVQHLGYAISHQQHNSFISYCDHANITFIVWFETYCHTLNPLAQLKKKKSLNVENYQSRNS